MPEDMEFMTIEEKIRYDLATANGSIGTVDGRVDAASTALNANGVGYVSACLESTETGNGIITVFNFTIPGGVMVTNSETVFSLGVQQKRVSQYSVTGAQQITFTGGNEPASDHVYMDVLVPVTFAF